MTDISKAIVGLALVIAIVNLSLRIESALNRLTAAQSCEASHD